MLYLCLHCLHDNLETVCGMLRSKICFQSWLSQDKLFVGVGGGVIPQVQVPQQHLILQLINTKIISYSHNDVNLS